MVYLKDGYFCFDKEDVKGLAEMMNKYQKKYWKKK
jgi:hypothetical protein